MRSIFEIIMLFIVGETPLLVAVKKNDEIMMQFLLDLGAHPDVTDFKVWMVRVKEMKEEISECFYVFWLKRRKPLLTLKYRCGSNNNWLI